MAFTEADTRANLIDPLLKECGWLQPHIVREYYFTDGRKLIGGKRGKRYFVDYLLHYNNTNLAIIEAKAEHKDPLDGLQQSINYAQKLGIQVVYATNGRKIYEHDLTTGKGEWVERFASPEALFARRFPVLTSEKETLIRQPFHFEGSMKPRYYQQLAVDKTLEAIANGQERVLLTLATGTGKTYIAFQVVYRLFEAKWSRDGTPRRPKVLFLADRNVLADQAFNTFNPLERDIIRVNGKEIRKRGGRVPTNANVFFAIYQSIAERKSDEFDEENDVTGYYRQCPHNFLTLSLSTSATGAVPTTRVRGVRSSTTSVLRCIWG